MRTSFLHLEGYHLKELVVELNEGFVKNASFGSWTGYHYQPDKTFRPEPAEFKVDSEIGKKLDDPSKLRYLLRINSTGKKDKAPYTFRIALVGYFRVDKEHLAERGNILLYANAPSLLYSTAREILASTTARGPYPSIILPVVSFLDDAEKLVADEAKPVGRPLLKGRIASTKKGAKKSHARKATKK
jgi:preprotein translocase subunit SecB